MVDQAQSVNSDSSREGLAARRTLTMDSPTPTELRDVSRSLIALRKPAMQRLMVGSALGRTPVHTYRILMDEARRLDLADSGADTAAFQRRFNGYYAVRRNAVWRAAYYEQFQLGKSHDGPAEALFANALTQMHKATRRVEASFVSKLVATLNPSMPVIDSVVRSFLVERLSTVPKMNGLDGAQAFYGWLNRVMLALSETKPATDWFAEFDGVFVMEPGGAEIADMKRLDFLIWVGADR